MRSFHGKTYNSAEVMDNIFREKLAYLKNLYEFCTIDAP